MRTRVATISSSSRIGLASVALTLSALTVVSLVLENDHDDEISKVSARGWWPCFLGGDCHVPTPSRAAAWKQEAKFNQIPGLQGSGGGTTAPCLLGGPCALPRERDVAEWKSSVNHLKRKEQRHEMRLASRNHLPMKKRKVSHSFTLHKLQKIQRREILRAARNRVSLILTELQTTFTKKSRQAKDLQKLQRRKIMGKGAIRASAELLPLLKKYPDSQKYIAHIMDKVNNASVLTQRAISSMHKAKALQEAATQTKLHLTQAEKLDKRTFAVVKAKLKKQRREEHRVHGADQELRSAHRAQLRAARIAQEIMKKRSDGPVQGTEHMDEEEALLLNDLLEDSHAYRVAQEHTQEHIKRLRQLATVGKHWHS